MGELVELLLVGTSLLSVGGWLTGLWLIRRSRWSDQRLDRVLVELAGRAVCAGCGHRLSAHPADGPCQTPTLGGRLVCGCLGWTPAEPRPELKPEPRCTCDHVAPGHKRGRITPRHVSIGDSQRCLVARCDCTVDPETPVRRTPPHAAVITRGEVSELGLAPDTLWDDVVGIPLDLWVWATGWVDPQTGRDDVARLAYLVARREAGDFRRTVDAARDPAPPR